MGGDSRNLANYTLIFRPIYKGGVIGYTVASLYRSSLPQLPFAHTHCAKLQKRSLTTKRSETEIIFLWTFSNTVVQKILWLIAETIGK